MSASNNVKELSSKNFDESIKSGTSLVDFWASWCMPCRMQGPIIDSVAEKINGKANICKLNVDDYGDIAGKYGVMSIPTLIIFKNGDPVKQFVGVQSEDVLLKALENN
jgi:thioredoxin 1